MELSYHLWSQSESVTQSTAASSTFSSSNSPRLVLLHGMGGTGALWRPLAVALEKDMTILAPDQRGHGKSRLVDLNSHCNSQESYTPIDYGQDVIDTLKALKWNSVWILGHSMGVRTAVAAAHLQPHWVRGLILVDLGFTGLAGGGFGKSLAGFLRLLPESFLSRKDARDFMTAHCPDPAIIQYLLAVSQQDEKGGITFPFDHAALIQTLLAAQNFSLHEWVEDLSDRGIPICVLRGERSLVWSHEEFEKERLSFAHRPNVQFQEIPNAGHGLPFEQRALLAELIRSSVKKSF